MNSSEVAEFEELSAPEFTHHADSAFISNSGIFFLVFSSFNKGKTKKTFLI